MSDDALFHDQIDALRGEGAPRFCADLERPNGRFGRAARCAPRSTSAACAAATGCATTTASTFSRSIPQPSPVHSDDDIDKLVGARSEIWSPCALSHVAEAA